MALTDAFLGGCRAAIGALPELTTFRSAQALTAHTLAGRTATYNRAFGDALSTPSPAYNLALAIRNTVNARADADGTLGLLDRETAYSTLAAEYVPATDRPPSEAAEAAELEQLLAED
jgi:hypothetical protein